MFGKVSRLKSLFLVSTAHHYREFTTVLGFITFLMDLSVITWENIIGFNTICLSISENENKGHS